MKMKLLMAITLCVLLSACKKVQVANVSITEDDVEFVAKYSTLGAPVDADATAETRALFHNLHRLATQGIMFGHEADNANGYGWQYTPGRSDVKEVVGEYPAVFGWDMGQYEIGYTWNVEGTNFVKMRQYIKDVYDQGGVNTISWHMHNPMDSTQSAKGTMDSVIYKIFADTVALNHYKAWLGGVATYVKTLVGSDGKTIPIIFRPFHEHTGTWFWWGKDRCTPDEFKNIWRFTIDYFRSQGVHNLLYAYSPDRITSQSDYLERYPGDDYVDILGLDCYDTINFHPGNTFITTANPMISIVTTLARQKSKLSAITETGLSQVPVTNWWTQFLSPITKDKNLSYVLLWRNFQTQFWTPYVGQASAPDFVTFHTDETNFFQHRIASEYLYKTSLLNIDFETSNTLADYQNASGPNYRQFNAIATDAGSTIAIDSARLKFTGSGAATSNSYIIRSNYIAPVDAKLMMFSFNISNHGSITPSTNPVIRVQFGTGFTINNLIETASLTHSEFGIHFPSDGHMTFVDENAAVTGTGNYTGEKNVRLIVNNSGAAKNYIAPDGTTESIANDTWDLWVGTVKEFNDRTATNAAKALNNFKMNIKNIGGQYIDLDDFNIKEL